MIQKKLVLMNVKESLIVMLIKLVSEFLLVFLGRSTKTPQLQIKNYKFCSLVILLRLIRMKCWTPWTNHPTCLSQLSESARTSITILERTPQSSITPVPLVSLMSLKTVSLRKKTKWPSLSFSMNLWQQLLMEVLTKWAS